MMIGFSPTLAIDSGTTTGWALLDQDGRVTSGTWKLQARKGQPPETRYKNFYELLTALLENGKIQRVVYEKVYRHIGTDAAHCYGGLIAVLTIACLQAGISFGHLPVQTIKKHATGKGNAKKDMMLLFAKKKWPGYTFKDDNEVDARWILDCWLVKNGVECGQ